MPPTLRLEDIHAAVAAQRFAIPRTAIAIAIVAIAVAVRALIDERSATLIGTLPLPYPADLCDRAGLIYHHADNHLWWCMREDGTRHGIVQYEDGPVRLYGQFEDGLPAGTWGLQITGGRDEVSIDAMYDRGLLNRLEGRLGLVIEGPTIHQHIPTLDELERGDARETTSAGWQRNDHEIGRWLMILNGRRRVYCPPSLGACPHPPPPLDDELAHTFQDALAQFIAIVTRAGGPRCAGIDTRALAHLEAQVVGGLELCPDAARR